MAFWKKSGDSAAGAPAAGKAAAGKAEKKDHAIRNQLLGMLAIFVLIVGGLFAASQFSSSVKGSLGNYTTGVKDLGAEVAGRGVPKSASDLVAPAEARALLDGLAVKGKAAATGYTREQFGQAWTDDNDVKFGRNGCRTREDILARDLNNVLNQGCKVMSGTLEDPYTAKTIQFTRGPQSSSAVQIDHVVALKNAWITGAQQLSERQRVNLANDPLNLLAVDGPTNEAKGDGDAATWLPPNKGFRCAYVTRQIQVKAKYTLWVTQAEKTSMQKVLESC